MTTPSPEPLAPSPRIDGRSRLAALAVTIASGVIVLTCGTRHEEAPPPATPPVALASASPDPEASAIPTTTAAAAPPLEAPIATAPASAEPAPTPAPGGTLPRTGGPELDNFYAALREL